MHISRRSLTRKSPVFASSIAAMLTFPAVKAEEGTPAATPVADPESILEALLASPVTTPLFPPDTLPITPTEWLDDGDTDLDEAVGGVLMQTGEDELENPEIVGVYIVHPGPEAARERFDAQLGDNAGAEPLSLLGHSGTVTRTPGNEGAVDGGFAELSSTLIALVAGPVIVSAIGEGEDEAANDLRALANMAGMLDHLRSVSRTG